MYIKWIVCKVEESQKGNFSKGQSKWSEMAKAPGFIAQLGGWDTKNPSSACILSIWGDRNSYDHFMADIHDSITASNNQEGTYTSRAIDFFEHELVMPGNSENLSVALKNGSCVRIADCQVKPSCRLHFEDVQKKVWIPAMSQSTGMLGGSFNHSVGDQNRYLVTSLWKDEDLHEVYARDRVPGLRERANVAQDLEAITGRLVTVEKSWSVFPF